MPLLGLPDGLFYLVLKIHRRQIQKRKEPPFSGWLFHRENSSNGGKAIRTFWLHTRCGARLCQGKIRPQINTLECGICKSKIHNTGPIIFSLSSPFTLRIPSGCSRDLLGFVPVFHRKYTERRPLLLEIIAFQPFFTPGPVS